MLCEDCHKEIKPIVAVDVDGTLGDYHRHFLRFAADYFGWDRYADDYYGEESFKSWWMERHSATDKMWHDAKLSYRQGGMKRTMPIFDRAQELCWSIADLGAELWITTTRPYLSLDNIVPDTVEWLRRHDIGHDGMLFDEDKYKQLADRVDSRRVVAVLDDLPEMYDAAATALHYGWDVPILIRGKFNAKSWRTNCESLSTVVPKIENRINEWREQNG